MAPERNAVRPAPGRPGPWGFTLLEVMIALAIFALAAIVLGAGYVNILNSYVAVGKGTAEDTDLAFARQQLMTINDINVAEAGEEFDTPDVPSQPGLSAQNSYHVKWTADIEPTTLPDLFTVTLTCVESNPALGPDPKTVSQTLMLLRPTWSDQTQRTGLVQAEAARIATLQGRQP